MQEHTLKTKDKLIAFLGKHGLEVEWYSLKLSEPNNGYVVRMENGAVKQVVAKLFSGREMQMFLTTDE